MTRKARERAAPTSEDQRWWRSLPYVRRKLRLYADHQFPRQSVDGLRGSGIDVWYAQEHEVARHQDDSYHYERARKLKRLLVTLDKDFLDDRRYPLHESPGVILVNTGSSRDPHMAGALLVALLAPFLKEGLNRFPNIWTAAKLTVSASQIVLRQRTYASEVEETVLWSSG